MTMRALVSACAVAARYARCRRPGPGPGARRPQGTTTFTKDVLPILQKNCQSCHRPGEIGPMPLLTYAQARPYARAIKTATQSKKMPPWFADSSVQHYANDMSLPAADISTLAAWADAGAPEGDPKDAPAARHVRGRLEHRHARQGGPDARAVPRAGGRDHRIHLHHSPDALHRRHLGAGARNPAGQPLADASRRAVRAHAGFQVAARVSGRRPVCPGAAAREETAVERRRSHVRGFARRRVAGRLRARRAALYAAAGHRIPRQGQLRFRPAAALHGQRHGGNGSDAHRHACSRKSRPPNARSSASSTTADS